MENRPAADVKAFQFSAIDCGSTAAINSVGAGTGFVFRDLDF